MRLMHALVILVPLSMLCVGSAAGDAEFHTTRLNFSVTAQGLLAGNPTLLAGQVVDIHPDGPQIGALEQYMINGAKPDTSYQVVLRIFAGNCAGSLVFPNGLATALLVTDGLGFAHGSHVFTPADLPPPGTTAGVEWTLVSGTIIAYDTSCIFVTIA